VSETVGANASYRRYVTEAKAAGYIVREMCVGLQTMEQSIARVAMRVRAGGHSIPEADIPRRWPAVHANLSWFAAHADILEIYSNAGDRAEPVSIGLVRQGAVERLDPDARPEVTRALASLPRAQ
jgi:predicted ABC-type ATPase